MCQPKFSEMRRAAMAVFLISIAFSTCGNVFAVPAYPGKVIVKTASGREAIIFMQGDEHCKYAFSSDGYTLVSDTAGWWYANLSADGKLMKTNHRLALGEDETEELRAFKNSCLKSLTPRSPLIVVITRRGMNCNRSATNGSSVNGVRRALVILMQYKDLSFKQTNEDFDALFNELGYDKDGAIGSVRDYYRFASQGQFDYITDVYGPYTSTYNMSYYGTNASVGGNDAHAVDLCREAMKSLPKDIDLAQYDHDGDGLIDNVHIIYAGYGEEAGAPSYAIWAHEYPHLITMNNEIGYSLAGYSCSPELRGNHGNNISHIGVVCHELGHALGAMDYYDTNYATGGQYEGTGKWDIMAGGSWNDNGRTPPNFNPFVRSMVFGWSLVETLAPSQHIVMPSMMVDADQSVVYKMETSSEGDYFLLENRQQQYFDAALPGAGLVIYHIHPNIERLSRTNTVNTTHPQGIYPVCASSSDPARKKYGNINSAECPFPGKSNVRTFAADSSPAAVAWNGSSTQVGIYSITQHPSDGSVSFSTSEEAVIDPGEPDTPTEKNLAYKESFESGNTKNITSLSIFGKETWRLYKKGDFVVGSTQIPDAIDGKGLIMLFSQKNSAMSISEARSDKISVEPGKNYVITADIQVVSISSSPTPQLTVYAEDQYGEYNLFTLNEVTTEWRTIEMPIVFADSTFCYTLHGTIYAGGIFVDNIRLYKEEEVSSIRQSKNAGNNFEVYHIDGSKASSSDMDTRNFRHGIYIVKQSDGKTRKIIR